ncbi:Cyclin-like F-box protein [Rutstroemia sp. NJR-2017a BBW]|nr:Cyclin-like F-box protein [Rutstroemia sp. NJR-2017a BBW]
MRGRLPNMSPINADAGYRATPDLDEDSHSSTSNSPARADYEESDFFTGNNDSSSSIGVPTFQDMAVTEENCVSASNRLPAEVLIGIFSKLSSANDLLNCMRVSKVWAINAVDLLWLRPACTTFVKLGYICRTLSSENPYFAYREFIKRLNLAMLAERINDGSVDQLSVCNRVERLTLTGCIGLTDHGLIKLLMDSSYLLALDISGDTQITEASMYALAENCRRLQGLNISMCTKISSESMIRVAEACRHLKRLKLNGCTQLDNNAIMAFAQNCRNILEIDLHQCKEITNEPITSLITNGNCLRELRLASCELISDNAFLNLPNRTYEHLRILDLTSCARLTDAAVDKIITVAPRLRNIVFAKCRNLTDQAVNSISRLGKNLHYLHLGHCGQITDAAVVRLVQACNRIRYIDLGCCVHITDASVMKLALLPKLRRIGLVKCAAITDASVRALAEAQKQRRTTRYLQGEEPWGNNSLERVHLSYCTNLTLQSIIELLNNCQKLTHLSLTGVQAFLRTDLEKYCREAPPEFTEHQRNVFCVFSGPGVFGLRNHLNQGNGAERESSQDADDDRTMTGMMSAAALGGDDGEGEVDADADGDEELEDFQGGV